MNRSLALGSMIPALLGLSTLMAQTTPSVTLKGKLIDDISRQGVAGVQVTVAVPNGRTPLVVESDASGHFEIAKAAPGNYEVRTQKPGYFQGTRQISVTTAAVNDIGDTVLVRIRTISGRITWEDGTPAIDSAVQVMVMVDGKPQFRQAVSVRTYPTNEQGEYVISGLRPESYGLVASSYKAVDAGDFPPRIAMPSFYPGSPFPEGAAAIDLSRTEQSSNINFVLKEQKGVPITVTVSPSNERPDGTKLFVSLRLPNSPVRNLTMIRAVVGKPFRFFGVPEGDYLFVTSINDQDSARSVQPIHVGQEPMSVTIPVPGLRPIEGNVRYEEYDRAAFANDASAPSPKIGTVPSLYMKAESESLLGFGGSFATADRDGRFKFTDIAQGLTYGLEFQRLPQDSYVSSVTQGGTKQTAGRFSFIANGLPIEITLRNDSGRIYGNVRGPDNLPHEAFVVLVPQDRQARARYLFVNAGANGRFALLSIAPGKYDLFAFEENEEFRYLNPAYLEKHASGSVEVQVRPGVNQALDLKVIRTRQ